MAIELPLYNQDAETIGTVALPERMFGVPMNEALLHQVVTSQESNRRVVHAHAKTRAEVRGGGKKPWRQKGTGRARHGSIRSPIWRGGGATHGPTLERNFTKKINKKMARAALSVALSAKVRDGSFIVVDELKPTENKTKILAQALRALSQVFPNSSGRTRPHSILVIGSSDEAHTILRRLIQNIPYARIMDVRDMNTLDILASKNVVAIRDAIISTKES